MTARISPQPLEDGRRNLLGPVLKAMRLRKRVTQAALLAKLQRSGWDIAKQVLIYIESGSRTLTDVELFALLRALGATPGDLDAEFKKFCRK